MSNAMVISGGLWLFVQAGETFSVDYMVKESIEASIAKVAECPEVWVKATLGVARRLFSSASSLGNVKVIYSITVPAEDAHSVNIYHSKLKTASLDRWSITISEAVAKVSEMYQPTVTSADLPEIHGLSSASSQTTTPESDRAMAVAEARESSVGITVFLMLISLWACGHHEEN